MRYHKTREKRKGKTDYSEGKSQPSVREGGLDAMQARPCCPACVVVYGPHLRGIWHQRTGGFALGQAGAAHRIRARTPAGRWGEPRELIGAAVFLSSQASDFVNGQILTVDGGLLAAL